MIKMRDLKTGERKRRTMGEERFLISWRNVREGEGE